MSACIHSVPCRVSSFTDRPSASGVMLNRLPVPSQIRGGTPLASDPRVGSSLNALLAGCGRGRLLGPATTGLLAATQLAVLLSNVHRVRGAVGVA